MSEHGKQHHDSQKSVQQLPGRLRSRRTVWRT